MKILLLNGSPHERGCTYTALSQMRDTFETEGAQADIFWIGRKSVYSCIDCGKCAGSGLCAFDDRVNDFLKIAGDYDGFIFGSPVHYAGAAGALTAFMGRAFFADVHGGKSRFYLKPAATVVSARRAGTTAAIDQLNKRLSWLILFQRIIRKIMGNVRNSMWKAATRASLTKKPIKRYCKNTGDGKQKDCGSMGNTPSPAVLSVENAGRIIPTDCVEKRSMRGCV